MSWSDWPSNIGVGTLITQAFMDTYVADDLDFLHDAPACLFTRSSGQTIVNGNEAQLISSEISIDTDNMHNSNTEHVFNTAGIYWCGFTNLLWAANATGRRTAKFRPQDNPSSTIVSVIANAGAAQTMAQSAAGQVEAAAGDLFDVLVLQTSGGNLNVTAGHLVFAHWIGGPV